VPVKFSKPPEIFFRQRHSALAFCVFHAFPACGGQPEQQRRVAQQRGDERQLLEQYGEWDERPQPELQQRQREREQQQQSVRL
jgi:hypothetical protein